jgi:isochorismate pyruvate lyase
MKPPETCTNMGEIREEVSRIDHDVIALLGKRLAYVKSAVRFKPDEESIRNPEHWAKFFADRRAWARDEGYDPDVIEAMYRKLYDYTIEVQLELHRSKRKG